MKTTYIYCKTCKRVHEKTPARTELLEVLNTNSQVVITWEWLDALEHEIARSVMLPIEFIRL